MRFKEKFRRKYSAMWQFFWYVVISVFFTINLTGAARRSQMNGTWITKNEKKQEMEVAEKEKGDEPLYGRCKFVLFMLRSLYAQKKQYNIPLQNFMRCTYQRLLIYTGILNGPDTRCLMKDQAFENALKIDELVP
ncbi:unnamed protein product [Brassicogethes aeneus]|uniref:Uncharacterized protein n=1 Tax=Brassicogethes aeneus TaxID=1431903 RepID=A0A9P0AXA9_BRAAE|nr:unnamed protein product [Brassicogethes aeneus]